MTQSTESSAEVERAVREELEAHVDVPANAEDTLGLSSLAVVQLCESLEERFGFVVGADDLTPERFASVATIVAFVTEKLA